MTDITGSISYEVREGPISTVLLWRLPNGSGGSCQFNSPAAAKRYAKQAECGDKLRWTRVGKVPGTRRWTTEVVR